MNELKYKECFCDLTQSVISVENYSKLSQNLQDEYRNHIRCNQCKKAMFTFV